MSSADLRQNPTFGTTTATKKLNKKIESTSLRCAIAMGSLSLERLYPHCLTIRQVEEFSKAVQRTLDAGVALATGQRVSIDQAGDLSVCVKNLTEFIDRLELPTGENCFAEAICSIADAIKEYVAFQSPAPVEKLVRTSIKYVMVNFMAASQDFQVEQESIQFALMLSDKLEDGEESPVSEVLIKEIRNFKGVVGHRIVEVDEHLNVLPDIQIEIDVAKDIPVDMFAAAFSKPKLEISRPAFEVPQEEQSLETKSGNETAPQFQIQKSQDLLNVALKYGTFGLAGGTIASFLFEEPTTSVFASGFVVGMIAALCIEFIPWNFSNQQKTTRAPSEVTYLNKTS